MLKKLVLSSFFALLVAANLHANDKVYKLKLATTWENTTPLLGQAALDFKKYAYELSNGRLNIIVDTPAKHKSSFGIFNFVQTGQYDLGYTSLYYYKGIDPKTMFWTAVPFGMNTYEQEAWFYYGGGKELAQKLFDKYNMRIYPMGSTGMQMGGWFKKEIKSLADLKGLKIRIPGFGGEVMAKAGASINTIPVGELYMALDIGTIDAIEWAAPAYDFPLGFYKVAKYYYTGWQEPTGNAQLLVNKDVYNKLPKDLQKILEVAARQAGDDMLTHGFYENSTLWERMKKEYPDIQVKSFPKDVLDTLRKYTDETLQSEASKDPEFKEILDSYKKFQKLGRAWFKISDYSYVRDN